MSETTTHEGFPVGTRVCVTGNRNSPGGVQDQAGCEGTVIPAQVFEGEESDRYVRVVIDGETDPFPFYPDELRVV